jgi:hypothetical protein
MAKRNTLQTCNVTESNRAYEDNYGANSTTY